MNARWLPVLCTAAVLLFGCNDNNKKAETAPADKNASANPPIQPTEDPYARNPPANTGSSNPENYDATNAPPPGDTLQPISDTGTGKSKRTHVVKSGETLRKISKDYYGDPEKWKKIWEANKSRIEDPNKLKVGTKLIIP